MPLVLTLVLAKPCPFCGGNRLSLSSEEAEDAPEHAYTRVECDDLNCLTSGPLAKHMSYDDGTTAEHEAVSLWNARVNDLGLTPPRFAR